MHRRNKAAMQKLKVVGVTLLNQAVLLKDVNDTASAQIALSEALFDADILPYYLHLLDKVEGASHFDIPEQLAKKNNVRHASSITWVFSTQTS